jgi:hypothetical protein
MRVDDVWDDCVTSLSISCHEIGVGRRNVLYLAHILGHYPFVVVNAWRYSFSRSKWMYNIEGAKMVLVCHGGSSEPRRCILNKPVAQGLRKFPVHYCRSWDCGMMVIFGCLSLLAGIS